MNPRVSVPPRSVPIPHRSTIPAAWVAAFLYLTVLLASAWAVWALFTPPDSLPASAPATEFSAQRAMNHLEPITAAPRPLGSDGNAATRDYLISQLRLMGLEPELQDTIATIRFPGATYFSVARVQNIAVRLPGSDNTGSILLDAHYDGGATGPAASDCGSCVVTVLETLRALQAGPRLRNDVVAVFTDGEERGDLGAAAFAKSHPWVEDVALAMNYEAQGSGGPSVLYVTSPNSGWWVQEFIGSAKQPLTYSYIAALISLFPGGRLGCDLEEYMARGIAGLGFVYFTDTPAYHTQRDSIETIDPRSIQHHGSNTLAALRHFGNLNLEDVRPEPNAVYFALLPGVIIRYSETWVIPIAIALTIVLMAFLGYAGWHNAISIRRVLTDTFLTLFTIVVITVLLTLLWWGFKETIPSLQVWMVGSYGSEGYLVGFSLLAIAAIGVFNSWRVRHEHMVESLAGIALLCTFLMWVTAFAVPGMSYLFTWSLAALLVPIGWWQWRNPATLTPGAHVALVSFITAISVVLFLPPTVLTYPLTNRLDALADLPLAAIPVLFILITGSLVLPYLTWLLGYRAGHIYTVVALAGIIVLGAAAVQSGFSQEHPRPNMVAYELNADSGAARWITGDQRFDEWTAPRFAQNAIPAVVEMSMFRGMPGYAAVAPRITLAAPEATVVSDRVQDGSRILTLNLTSPRGAASLQVDLEAQGQVMSAVLEGHPLDLTDMPPEASNRLRFAYYGLDSNGITLSVTVQSPEHVSLYLRDWSDGLPAGLKVPPRPATTMAAPNDFLDPTIVSRSYVK